MLCRCAYIIMIIEVVYVLRNEAWSEIDTDSIRRNVANLVTVSPATPESWQDCPPCMYTLYYTHC